MDAHELVRVRHVIRDGVPQGVQVIGRPELQAEYTSMLRRTSHGLPPDEARWADALNALDCLGFRTTRIATTSHTHETVHELVLRRSAAPASAGTSPPQPRTGRRPRAAR
jgi:hypothetical protein